MILDLHLNLTPEEIHLVNGALAKDGQTLEEAFMSFIRLKLESAKKSKYPKMENQHVQKIIADVDENGTLVIPDSAPDHVKDWIRNG